MYRHLQRKLSDHIREFLGQTYSLDLPGIVIEQPPRVELGEYALPLAFELAKKLRKAPRKIAEEIVSGIGPIDGFEKFAVAGAGYINAYLKRGPVAASLAADENPQSEIPQGKVLVEHSSINPNKAAHVGHLRNAILGDTFVRLLRFWGRKADVQNYIDNTGVQVADVVVGFLHIQKKSREEIEQLACVPRFDYYCWDLYALVSQWYQADKQNLQLRSQTLHDIEQGGNEVSAIAEIISVAVLRRHLETMDRLDIEYDFLPRESEILTQHFWDAAFEKLKAGGVLFFENEGKNKGCWVMRRAGTGEIISGEKTEIEIRPQDLRLDTYVAAGEEAQPGAAYTAVRITHIPTGFVVSSDKEKSQHKNRERAMTLLRSRLSELQQENRQPTKNVTEGANAISEEDQKVIVRSNGTVGYVGKDIAYHMWKFGLLGRDFGYSKFYRYPNGHECWISSTEGEANHPHFGNVEEIYNVIDARQSEAQNTVIDALRGLGYDAQADHYTHFSYEMVALTPRCAAELGYELSEEDKKRPYIEVSGRKGFGVKADDLLDRLIASAKAEVDSRHPELSDEERSTIATQIAVGALRYFMLKFTKGSVIAFDFKDALSFEGETGPYVQYAVLRAANIFRKAGVDPQTLAKDVTSYVFTSGPEKYLDNEDANGIWEIWLAASKTSYVIDQAIATTEPAYLAKHAFQLAQLFNVFYHRYPVLSESDEDRKRFLLATVGVVRRELTRVLAVMGIAVPEVM